MGSSNVIAEAGLSVVNMFKEKMTPEPISSPELIGLCLPQEPEDFQLTVWIYNLEEEKGAGNAAGYQPDPADPALERFAPMNLKLFMLVSSHSKAPAQVRAADEYRIIGRALQVVRDMPYIEEKHLEGSLLGDAKALKIEMLKLSSEELTKIWNNSSKPVKMSFGLSLSVSLESTLTRKAPGRVTHARIEVKQDMDRQKIIIPS